MPLEPAQLRNALASIIDPETKKDIVSAGMIKDICTEDDSVSIELEITSTDAMVRQRFEEEVEAAIRNAGQVHQISIAGINVSFSSDTHSANQQVKDAGNPLPNIKKIIAVFI